MAEFKRARNPKAKEIRKHSILDAAARLFQEDPSSLPTTSQISKHCEISKGALYLYFKSKEEIFLAIIETHLIKWLEIFNVDSLGDVQQKLDATVINSLIDKCCTYATSNPVFMQLASMNSSVIEPNVDDKILLTHKNDIGQKLSTISQSMSTRLETLSNAQIASLILRTYSILLGLWQTSNPIEKVSRVLQTSNLHILTPDFPTTSREMIKQLWQVEIEANKGGKGGLLGRFFSSGTLWSN